VSEHCPTVALQGEPMKKFLLTTLTSSVLALPAMAADLAPVPHEQVWSWTGFYFGGTVGGGWMTSNSNETVTSTFCNPAFSGCPAVGPALAAAIPTTYNTAKAGFLAGAEAGYNWQFGQFVVGIETDLSGASISGSSSVTNAVSVVGFPGFAVAAYGTQSEKLDYFGTVRGRAGFLVTNPLLAYVTGGFAYGDASASNSLGANIVGGPCIGCSPGVTGESTSSKQAGWTVGGGLEWMFAPNFTVKGEYLYYDFGSVSFAGPTTISPATYGASTAATADFKGSVVRVGLNFKL
jgi:outer membrane immunogenic protein